jgi:hypothetical protein
MGARARLDDISAVASVSEPQRTIGPQRHGARIIVAVYAKVGAKLPALSAALWLV